MAIIQRPAPLSPGKQIFGKELPTRFLFYENLKSLDNGLSLNGDNESHFDLAVGFVPQMSPLRCCQIKMKTLRLVLEVVARRNVCF